MCEVKEKVNTLQRKYQQFKQHQNTFIVALDRSRKLAVQSNEPVSSVQQVKNYLTFYCNSSTDRLVFKLFLDLVSGLRAALKLLEVSTVPSSPDSGGALDSCRRMLSPGCNITNLVAQYPHDMVNRLSCIQARNYSGVISLVALALDLLKQLTFSLQSPSPRSSPASGDHPHTSAQRRGRSPAVTEKILDLGTSGVRSQRTNQGWGEGKPAWRPPGRGRL